MPLFDSFVALQLTAPKIKISTQAEVFEFARCVDPERKILWNIESKINPVERNSTKGVTDFVELQLEEFNKSGYPFGSITCVTRISRLMTPYMRLSYQSFDWRTLVAMKVGFT